MGELLVKVGKLCEGIEAEGGTPSNMDSFMALNEKFTKLLDSATERDKYIVEAIHVLFEHMCNMLLS